MSQPYLILTVISAYFLVWVVVCWLSGRGSDNATFFSGNRKMKWPLVAIAMIGAPITGVTFISVPGMVVGKGLSYLQMCLGFIVGYLVIAFVLVPLYYRLNIVSVYGYLQKRFGQSSYKTGAWLFFVSKILGISVRFLIICAMLQLLVFDPLGIPYYVSVVVGLMLVWVSTYRGGVKSVIWGDTLKSVSLIAAIALCLYFVVDGLGFSAREITQKITDHESFRIFYFDDPADSKYFWKQFIAGIFIVIAMTGLDQDMMQRTLACRNARDSRKNLILSSIMQVVVISLLLTLGIVMVIYLQITATPLPEKTDNIFATVAFHDGIPLVVGILFIIGLVAATYSSVASALTSMTTSVTVDVLEAERKCDAEGLGRKRKRIHALIALLMAVMVICLYYLNKDDAISMVYTIISFTDGPILGLFTFGIFSRRQVNERLIPFVCIIAPVLSWLCQWTMLHLFEYQIGYELLLLNAGFTILGMRLISKLPVPAGDPLIKNC